MGVWWAWLAVRSVKLSQLFLRVDMQYIGLRRHAHWMLQVPDALLRSRLLGAEFGGVALEAYGYGCRLLARVKVSPG
jgi:hypothetical protein